MGSSLSDIPMASIWEYPFTRKELKEILIPFNLKFVLIGRRIVVTCEFEVAYPGENVRKG